MLATVVDTSALWQTILAAFVAGVGTTLVFTSDGEAMVADAGTRRDARRRDDPDEPVGAGVGGGSGSGRRKRGSVLDLPDTESGDKNGGGRPN